MFCAPTFSMNNLSTTCYGHRASAFNRQWYRVQKQYLLSIHWTQKVLCGNHPKRYFPKLFFSSKSHWVTLERCQGGPLPPESPLLAHIKSKSKRCVEGLTCDWPCSCHLVTIGWTQLVVSAILVNMLASILILEIDQTRHQWQLRRFSQFATNLHFVHPGKL